ncbi:hypothetical protein LUZ63_000618 [Rhynchospora breviuscula]|uniref:DUF4220 domain-containing protein n=1 Tax=Rhynchospora breviuscula TaxID=2022672 RepID=A0A9Q0CV94_9POAL|nr:hypothetical protein LUZ63_000618 [Rhynchospora breviuscula]
MHAGETIKALLVSLRNSDDAKLARTEFQVVLVGILVVALFIMDAYRFCNNSFVRKTLAILQTVTNPLVIYTVGLIQNITTFGNQFISIWAVLLYILESGTEYLCAYSLTNFSMRRRVELKELLLTFFTANLIATTGSKFHWFLWVLWSMGPIMIIYKLISFELARESYSYGQNSKLMVEYMKNVFLQNQHAQPDPIGMRGYKYLVRGEDAQEIRSQAPSFQVELNITNQRKLITLEKVWNCPGHLLTTLDQKLSIRDVCLSYALYKLLRCQMIELSLPRKCQDMTQKLIFEGVLHGRNDKRVFNIMEMQMAFLMDYYYTRIPIGVWYGYPLIKFVTLLVTVVFGCLLAFDVHKTEPQEDDLYHFIKGLNVDRIITYALLVSIAVKEGWEMILYMLSDWTKLVVICRYVEGSWFLRNRLAERIILLLCRSNVVKRWHNKMGQYNFLESFNYKPWVKQALHYGTLHIIRKPIEGGKVGKNIKIFQEVKQSIVDALVNINDDNLMNSMPPSLYNRGIRNSNRWACKQETFSHLILVWHIATSMCEIQLFEDTRPERSSSKSFLYKLKTCWMKPHAFIVDLKSLESNTSSHYIVANSISRYCAYLLVFVPELLPDHILASEQVFLGTITDARNILGGCHSLGSVLAKLKSVEGGTEGMEGNQAITIVQKGAILGRELLADLEMNTENLWKMLADFWVNLLLYLAPSSMTEVHKSHLFGGGEFITLLWALFSNCGIFDRADEENQERANSIVVQEREPVNQVPANGAAGGEGQGTVNQVPANGAVGVEGQGTVNQVPANGAVGGEGRGTVNQVPANGVAAGHEGQGPVNQVPASGVVPGEEQVTDNQEQGEAGEEQQDEIEEPNNIEQWDDSKEQELEIEEE